MNQFRYGHAAAENWLAAATACREQMLPVPAGSSLGFLYVTDAIAQDMPLVLEYFRENTGVEHWVGTVGIGICACGIEYYNQPAIAAMLGEFPENAFRVFDSVSSDLEEFEKRHGQWVAQSDPYLGLVHADPRNQSTERLIKAMAEETTTGFLVGGLASSRRQMYSYADALTEGGLSGVLFSAAIPVVTRLSQGCSPIGPQREITEAQRNILIRVDDRPALEVFKEDIGEVLARDLSRVGGYIFAALPIAGSDTGDYLVRNLIGIDPKNELVAIGEMVSAGDPVMFCRRDADTARADLRRMLGELKKPLTGRPRGGVYVSCLGRGASLFGSNSGELRLIRDELGEFPLVGFYANGEISQDRLYGYTGVLTLFL